MSDQDYYESLKQIGDFLLENKGKTEYILNCFFQQDVREFDLFISILFLSTILI